MLARTPKRDWPPVLGFLFAAWISAGMWLVLIILFAGLILGGQAILHLMGVL